MRIWQRLIGRLKFLRNRARERLWVKPLMMCLISIGAAFLAGVADQFEFAGAAPEISLESIRVLLQIISSSMLVIAVFAVGSMISAYASASSGATPRSFALVVADDVSQNALSTFIGAFIFSIIALIALLNGYYGQAGRFTLFLLTILVFVLVILRFVRWVDGVARLGRLGNTTDKVEQAAERALRKRRENPTLGAARASGAPSGPAVYADSVGYVQRVDTAALQTFAEDTGVRIRVVALPGAFASPGKPLAHIEGDGIESEMDCIREAFIIGRERTFDDDPRFGLLVLSEIASRALSPAVNDAGTAIDIIGTFVRLFYIWADCPERENDSELRYDRVEVPEIQLGDLFADAFNAIARDGAAILEVGVRLQKAFQALASHGGEEMQRLARAHAKYALSYAEQSLKLPEEIEVLRGISV